MNDDDVAAPMPTDPTAHKIAYVQALLEYTRDDARQVHIRVTAVAALVTVLLTQLPFARLRALNETWTNLLYLGIASVAGGALCYFLYVGATHHARREIAKYLLTPELVTETTPDDKLTHVWREWNLVTFWVGGALTFGGLALLGAVTAKLISS